MVILAIIPMMLGTAKKGTKGPQHRARDEAREGKGVICASDDEAQPAKEQSDSAVQPGRRRRDSVYSSPAVGRWIVRRGEKRAEVHG